MNAYRDQERFDGDVTTIVSNNSNFVKGAPGEPVLIGWDDADTLFHEFGHALHGLALQRHLPVGLRDLGAPRLRRVPLPDPGALALHARAAERFARHVQDRPAHAHGAPRQDREGLRRSTRGSPPSSTWRPRWST